MYLFVRQVRYIWQHSGSKDDLGPLLVQSMFKSDLYTGPAHIPVYHPVFFIHYGQA